MFKMLNKEFKLTCMLITYLFLAFTLMTFIPSYPILVSAFFICMGIFYSFQFARESNDILYTSLLPIKKRDVVKAKFIFVIALELIAFALYAIFTIIYVTALGNVKPFSDAQLMRPNLAYLGYILICYLIFNATFLRGYFKTGYYIGKPFVIFCIGCFIAVGLFETLHFFPALTFLNSIEASGLVKQIPILAVGIIAYIGGTALAFKNSARDFEKIDI